VILRDIRIKMLSRTPALKGQTVGGGECGGGLALREYRADLSAPNPHLVLKNPFGADSDTPQLYKVSTSDPEVFLLSAFLGTSPAPYYYTYVYQIDWSQGSSEGTVDIMAPNGKPFGATQPDTGPKHVAVGGKWAPE
jgi:hypothetical protein